MKAGSPDPQVLAALLEMRAGSEDAPPPVGDVAARRRNTGRVFNQVLAARPPVSGVETQQFPLKVSDGGTIVLRWYRRAGGVQAAVPSSPLLRRASLNPADQPGSAVLYLHGGGMILDWEHVGGLYDAALRAYVAASGVPMLAVDYRVAPEFPHPIPLRDCYAGLCWLADHAGELGVDPSRLMVMGDSAGGGLAAGVGLLARDRGGPEIAAQLLIYPMLDDRTREPATGPATLLTWSYDDNATGWQALLGGRPATGYAVPACATDLAGLPPTYLDVGGLDIFAEEDVAFAQRLIAAGVPVELHVYPGCPHAFDLLVPDADVSQRVMGHRLRYLESL